MDEPIPEAPQSQSFTPSPQPPLLPPRPPQAEHRRRPVWIWYFLGACLLFALVGLAGLFMYFAVRSGSGSSGFATIGSGKIAVVSIDGEITSADTIVAELARFNHDSSVKAIIIHIDSPGGGAAASQEIYHEVLRIREQHRKPIVASIESVGASGAYYVASAADKIYANQASVVGSIGVIMEWTNYGKLFKWARLKSEVIHAGALKDAGDPTRPMTPQERVYFQGLVNNMYGQFIHDVAVGRHLPVATVRPIATGQVWTGEQALPMHLIDKIGGFRVALLDTARSVGISGEPGIVRPVVRRRSLWDILASDPGTLFPNPGKIIARHTGFYFLWRG